MADVSGTPLEKRRHLINCNLEPTLFRITNDLVARKGVSVSSYVRRLIIDDLRNEGLLPDSIIAKLFLNRP
jgi:hypothetical protein